VREMKLATVTARVNAALRTGFIGFVYVVLVSCGFRMGGDNIPNWQAISMIWGIPFLIYLIDGAFNRATIGMRLTDVQFRMFSGDPISFWAYLGRLLIGILFYPLLPVILIAMFFDPHRRTLVDRGMGTAVWKRPSARGPTKSRGFEVIPLEERQS
jgi:uncharacterized RDD family membrane protein YckC